MNTLVTQALDAVYAEKLPTVTRQKTIDAILRAFNVTQGQRIVYMCEKFGAEPETLARFFTSTYGTDAKRPPKKRVLKIETDSDDARDKTPDPVTPKKRGRPPKSPPSIKKQRREAVKAPLTIAELARQAVNENIKTQSERVIQKILLPTGVRKQGTGVAWSVEEEHELARRIASGEPIRVADLSKDGKDALFDRTDKAINNKIQDLKQKLKTDADSH
jgi:hypothetical protein